jgi:integrase
MQTAYVADYLLNGSRHLRTFATRREAADFHAKVRTDIRAGTHTPESRSITVQEAGKLWLTRCKSVVERSTLENYEDHLSHIVAVLGNIKLSALTVPSIRNFEDQLAEKHSPVMVKKLLVSLSGILNDAMDRGLVAQNVAHKRRTRRSNTERHTEPLRVGVDIPSIAEIQRITGVLNGFFGRTRPLLLTAMFTGMRASEIRGLTWANVDLVKGEVHVRQRADRFGQIGSPKSKKGHRTVPLLPMVVQALREWKLATPRPQSDLVFPGERGNPLSLPTIITTSWHPAQIKVGVTNADGTAKYSGFHATRHFFASWCINRKQDGGRELPPKTVQTWLGHATLAMTMDTYGHLFPQADASSETAMAERAFLTPVTVY